MGAYLFPKIFSSFQKKYPHLDIYLHEEGSMSIREQLERDELDFGIITSGASHNLQLLPMTTSQIVACVPENSPLAAKERLTKDNIAAANVIMLKEGSFLRQTILGKLKEQSITPNIVLESNQVVTIKGLVASGVGISFLLDMVLEDAPERQGHPARGATLRRRRSRLEKGSLHSKAAQSFIDFCRDTLRKHKDKDEISSQS